MATVFNAPVTAIGIKDFLGICLLWGWTGGACNQFEKKIFLILLFARSRLLTLGCAAAILSGPSPTKS